MDKPSALHKAKARIRQLCCLGLGGEAVMPALLAELHTLVPSWSNHFFWLDRKGWLTNFYDEQNAALDILPRYLAEFHNRREQEVTHSFARAIRCEHGVLRDEQFMTVSRRAFYRSDFYNEILRPLGYDRLIRMVIRDGNRTLGFLQLFRTRRDPDFTTADIRRLELVQPFLAHALACARPGTDEPLAEDREPGENGLILADPDGHIIGFSPHARRLLFLATHPEIGRRIDTAQRLPTALRGICRNLRATTTDVAAPAPVLRMRNAWGSFSFRAYWLDTPARDSACIGIAIKHWTPLLISLVQGTRALPLSARQSEVAVLTASGLSHQRVADQLGLKRNTVLAHSRWIYSKLDVHDREGLRSRLLGARRRDH